MATDVIVDTLSDGIKLLPFLFITYLIMEYIEHKAGSKTRKIMQKAGKWGPVFGGVFGIVPQCGFSAAASNLYAGRIITLGTLIAIFLSTSDEMVPVLISEQAPFQAIIKILAVKMIIGVFSGLVIDMLIQRWKKGKGEKLRIEHICEHQRCHCSEGKIIKSAISHTIQIFSFILIITFLLNLTIAFVGEDNLSAFISGRAILGPIFAGALGLIPNCASSVILTQLYLEGILGAGSMIAGLLAGSGVGLLVLFRVNDNVRENIMIMLLLYFIGSISGIFIEFMNLGF